MKITDSQDFVVAPDIKNSETDSKQKLETVLVRIKDNEVVNLLPLSEDKSEVLVQMSTFTGCLPPFDCKFIFTILY